MGDADRIDRDALAELWLAVLRTALLDLRDGAPGLVTEAAAWFGDDGGTFAYVAEALEADGDFLRGCARRVLVQRFGALEAARLLSEPLIRPRRRGRRRRLHDRAAPATATAAS